MINGFRGIQPAADVIRYRLNSAVRIRGRPKPPFPMSSINPVGSSHSNAVDQYQQYLERLKAIKAATDQAQDTAKNASIEQSDTQSDADHDGD